MDAPVDQQSDAPIACTLEAGAVGDRLADWHAVMDTATRRLPLADGGWRIEFTDGFDVAELAALAAAEQRCCTFIRFAITIDSRGIALEAHAPAEAADILTTLFEGHG